MDRAKLEALEKLLAKATPGPWFADVSDSDTCDWEVNADEGKVAGEYGIESRDDAALMVADAADTTAGERNKNGEPNV